MLSWEECMDVVSYLEIMIYEEKNLKHKDILKKRKEYYLRKAAAKYE